jgi:hypothetical protein
MLTAAGIAQCNPVALSFEPPTIHAGEPGLLVATGTPGSLSLIGLDLFPGPTTLPGIGTFQLGLTSALTIFGAVLPANGRFELAIHDDCKSYTFTIYAQALTHDSAHSTSCLSNGAQLHIQETGTCGAPACILDSHICADFNCAPIAHGRSIWFNSVVHVTGLPPTGGIVGYRNAHIEFTARGVHYSLPIPNALMRFSPETIGALTTHDPVNNQFETDVPTSYSGNVFLSGLSFPVPVDLPGGIGPVTWRGQFFADQRGVHFRWKWAAAVYVDFSTDYNALGIKPVDGSSVLSPYPNPHLAGTPENFAASSNLVRGARGGGYCDFTGSYTCATTVGCCR